MKSGIVANNLRDYQREYARTIRRARCWKCRGKLTDTGTNRIGKRMRRCLRCHPFAVKREPRVTVDLIGKRYGNLIVVKRGESGRYPSDSTFSTWIVRCDCGTEKTIRHSNLKKTYSCGCLHRAAR